jgi:TetR/AcrR family transcriptional repressor of nem operon
MVRPRQFDEAAVIGEALDVFWANGYAGTSVDAIGAATGLGKGSLYGAFGGKRQIFGRVFERYCIDALGAASQALDGPDEGAATGSDPERGCFLAKSVAELGKRDTEVQARARETYTALEDHLTATIGAAQRYGR